MLIEESDWITCNEEDTWSSYGNSRWGVGSRPRCTEERSGCV